MSHVKIADARSTKKDDLLKMLKEAKTELSTLRVAQATNNAQNKTGKIRIVRKNIARILTVLSQQSRQTLTTFYASKNKKMPKNLRPKLTHRRRLALTKKEKSVKTHRASKLSARYPLRKFAVKL